MIWHVRGVVAMLLLLHHRRRHGWLGGAAAEGAVATEVRALEEDKEMSSVAKPDAETLGNFVQNDCA